MSDSEADPPSRQLVWLASYPKSGNTWTRVLLSNLLAFDRLDDERFTALDGSMAANRPLFDALSGLPSSDLTDEEIDQLRPGVYRLVAALATERQYLKVHDACHPNRRGEPIFPADCSLGAIYLVRHPYDVAVSYAFHQGHADYDRMIDQMNDPEHLMAGGAKAQLRQRTLGWSGHVRSWREQGEIPVLTVRYEDMLADTVAALERMARFLQLPQAGDAHAIARAVDASRFERLREKEDLVGFKERAPKSERFFRAGRSGDGERLLTKEQRARLYRAHHAEMEKLGYAP